MESIVRCLTVVLAIKRVDCLKEVINVELTENVWSYLPFNDILKRLL